VIDCLAAPSLDNTFDNSSITFSKVKNTKLVLVNSYLLWHCMTYACKMETTEQVLHPTQHDFCISSCFYFISITSHLFIVLIFIDYYFLNNILKLKLYFWLTL